MRGIGNHTPPIDMRFPPPDNTSDHIMQEVQGWSYWDDRSTSRWRAPVVHTEVAREIAAWWAEGDNGFTQFATSGTITPQFTAEIEHEIEEALGFQPGDTESRDAYSALRALLAYVTAAG
jgi:phospholipase/lecithinase/hemolysin